MQYGVAIRENSMIFEFPKKIKSRITTRYRSSTSERAPNRTESRGSEDLRAPQFAAAGLTARKRAPLEGPERAAGGRRWCVPTAERGPALGGKDVPAHGTTWLGLEDTVLSDIGQSQGDRHRGTPLARGP